MSGNPMTCSNCGTENPPERDYCSNCGQPLTASADEAARTQLEAQDRGGWPATGDEVGADSAWNTSGALGGGIVMPISPDVSEPGRPDQPGRTEGRPFRRS